MPLKYSQIRYQDLNLFSHQKIINQTLWYRFHKTLNSSQNLSQPQPSYQDKNSHHFTNQTTLNIDCSIDEEFAKEIKLGIRTVPAISGELRYKKFVRLVDIEVKRKWNSVLLDYFREYESDSLELLYQGTRDGFTTEQLEKRLKNQQHEYTLTFILSNHGQVFGGFQTAAWNFPQLSKYSHNAVTYSYDDSAFLFQLNKKIVMPVNKNSSIKEFTIAQKENYLIAFGKDVLKISSNCNTDHKQCSSNLHGGFILPKVLRNHALAEKEEYDKVDFAKQLDERRRSYLAGAIDFKVDEIEIYEMEFFDGCEDSDESDSDLQA
eukprot:403370343